MSQQSCRSQEEEMHTKRQSRCAGQCYGDTKEHTYLFFTQISHISSSNARFRQNSTLLKTQKNFSHEAKKNESVVYISVFTMCSFPHSQILFIFLALVNQGRMQNNYTHAPSISEWQTYLQALTKLTALLHYSYSVVKYEIPSDGPPLEQHKHNFPNKNNSTYLIQHPFCLSHNAC